AVIPAGQGGSLAGRALARVCVALRWTSVESAVVRQSGQEFVGQAHVLLDHLPNQELIADREVWADLVEERPSRPREVPPVVGELLDRGLAGVEDLLLVAATRRVPLVLHDARREFPVDRAAEPVHVP